MAKVRVTNYADVDGEAVAVGVGGVHLDAKESKEVEVNDLDLRLLERHPSLRVDRLEEENEDADLEAADREGQPEGLPAEEVAEEQAPAGRDRGGADEYVVADSHAGSDDAAGSADSASSEKLEEEEEE